MSGRDSKRRINFTNRVLFYDPAHCTVEAPLYIDDRQADARMILGGGSDLFSKDSLYFGFRWDTENLQCFLRK